MLGDWSRTHQEHAVIAKNTGVYGFNHGAMSYAFKDDGTGFIGKDGKGRIYFDGNSSTIYSSNWLGNTQQGMLLDIDDGYLKMQCESELDEPTFILLNNSEVENEYFETEIDDSLYQYRGIGDLCFQRNNQIVQIPTDSLQVKNTRLFSQIYSKMVRIDQNEQPQVVAENGLLKNDFIANYFTDYFVEKYTFPGNTSYHGPLYVSRSSFIKNNTTKYIYYKNNYGYYEPIWERQGETYIDPRNLDQAYLDSPVINNFGATGLNLYCVYWDNLWESDRSDGFGTMEKIVIDPNNIESDLSNYTDIVRLYHYTRSPNTIYDSSYLPLQYHAQYDISDTFYIYDDTQNDYVNIDDVENFDIDDYFRNVESSITYLKENKYGELYVSEQGIKRLVQRNESYDATKQYFTKTTSSSMKYITLGANQLIYPLSIGTSQSINNRRFKVDWNGVVYMKDGQFEGTISGSTISGGTIGGATIYAGNSTILDNDGITTKTIYIQDNSASGILGYISGQSSLGTTDTIGLRSNTSSIRMEAIDNNQQADKGFITLLASNDINLDCRALYVNGVEINYYIEALNNGGQYYRLITYLPSDQNTPIPYGATQIIENATSQTMSAQEWWNMESSDLGYYSWVCSI